MPSFGPLEFRSRAEYLTFVRQRRGVMPVRRALEHLLSWRGFPFRFHGWCHVCGRRTAFAVGEQYSWMERGRLVPNWREQLVCSGCGFNARLRGTVQVVDQVLRSPASSRVYLTEQVTPLFAWAARRFPGAVGSEWLGDGIDPGTVNAAGLRHEDLMRLSFPDSTFDLVMTLDVLEHVPDPRPALAECRRVLAPDGTLLLTCPFDPGRGRHLVRARRTAAGTIEHLLPPEYHGNPLSPEGSLAYRVFGWDLLDDLRDVGFRDVRALDTWSCRFGYLGPYVQVFLAE